MAPQSYGNDRRTLKAFQVHWKPSESMTKSRKGLKNLMHLQCARVKRSRAAVLLCERPKSVVAPGMQRNLLVTPRRRCDQRA